MSIPYTAELYGESFADVYDIWYSQVSDAKASANYVANLCGPGTVLELGIGSGRLAQPLLDLGITVFGIDASIAMLQRCQPSDRLTLLLGDMRNLPFDVGQPTFDVALIGFNTLFNLVTETEQRQLFQDVSNVLRPGGYLIVEATNHDILMFETGNPDATHSFGVTRRDDESLVVASTDVDYSSQQIDGCHIEVANGGITLRPWKLRWSSTEQLDTYAAAAGMALYQRSAGWDHEPFSVDSVNHVSVYQRR